MHSTRTLLCGLLVVFSAISASVPGQPPFANVETVEEHWPNGQLRLRKEVLRLEDGTVVDHGSFQRWHDNGKKEYEAVFVEGKKEGTTLRYHKNGRVSSEQEYRDGKRHGRSVTWNDAGEMVKEEHWMDGRPHGTWTIWQEGKVKWSHTYDHGKP
jgi:antitoxin component YwqK of YwqJK toxin-antitoxin module